MQPSTCIMVIPLMVLGMVLSSEVVMAKKSTFHIDGSLKSSIKPLNNLFKVALTQKGYIQFLRYQVDVPPLYDFTFCLWMRTVNFTYPHPIFSYSRHETERLIRSWLTPTSSGAIVNMAILEQTVMKIHVHLVERRWYHICNSWDSSRATWQLHINSELVTKGEVPQLHGMKIPGGGDILVGQEYTDADKGLDDGIEGEVFGFNLIGGQMEAPHRGFARELVHDLQSADTSSIHIPRTRRQDLWSTNTTSHNSGRKTRSAIQWNSPATFRESMSWTVVPNFLPHSSRLDTYGSSWLTPPLQRQRRASLGAQLVRESFLHCVDGRGSPIDRNKLLISWANTPVRVFGGATVSNARPICGHF